MSLYSEKLKDHKWAVKRTHIILRDENACRYCGRSENLQVHHTVYLAGKEPWDYEDKFLITLCDTCHDQVEVNKEKIKWSLAYLQTERPWCLENVVVDIKRLIRYKTTRNELTTKLEEINTHFNQ